ncbi:MAG: arylesterase [Pseudomonadota bacterium]
MAITFSVIVQPVAAAGVLVVGDSLSAGYGIDEREGWVALLRDRLAERATPVPVINASISGDTTSGGLTRLPAALDRHRPDIVVIELGGNDGLRGQSLKNIRKNLSSMVQLVKESGAEAVLLGMRIPTNYGARYTQRFFDSFKQIADEEDVPLVPFFLEGVATEPSLMQDDGIHPNAEAQPMMLEHVWPAIEELL